MRARNAHNNTARAGHYANSGKVAAARLTRSFAIRLSNEQIRACLHQRDLSAFLRGPYARSALAVGIAMSRLVAHLSTFTCV